MKRPSPDEIVSLWQSGSGVVAHMQSDQVGPILDQPIPVIRELVRLLEYFDLGAGDDLVRRGLVPTGQHRILHWFLARAADSGADPRLSAIFVPLLNRIFRWCEQHGSMRRERLLEVVPIKRDRHIVTEDDPQLADLAEDLRSAHHGFLRRHDNIESPQEKAGCIAVSLILDNGLAYLPGLKQVMSALVAPVSATQQHFYVDYLNITPGESSDSYRRLLLVPITTMVVIRYGDALSEMTGTTVRRWVRPVVRDADLSKWVRSYLDRLDVPKIPKSLRTLNQWARALLRMKLPQYLAAFAYGEIKSTSLPETRFRRVFGVRRRNPPSIIRRLQLLSNAHIDKPVAKQRYQHAKDLCSGLLVFDGPDALISALPFTGNQSPKDLQVPIRQLAECCLHILNDSKTHSSKLQYTRVRRVLSWMGPGFITAVSALNTQAITSEDLLDLQEVLISPLLLRPNASTLLKDLTQLLRAYATVVGLPTGIIRAFRIPRAGVYTPDEILRIQAHFDSPAIYAESARERLLNQALLDVWQSNLRTSEGHLIDLGHAQDNTLEVRKTKRRSLKNPGSARNVPMEFTVAGPPNALLDFISLREHERRHIQNTESRRDSDFLFYAPPELVIPRWRITKAFKAAIFQETVDRHARLYELRHTWANAAFLGKASEELGLDDIQSQLGFFSDALTRYPLWSKYIFGPSNAVATYPYHVGKAMGHARFKTTHENYLHFLGVLLRSALNKYLPVLASVLVGASGQPKRTAFRRVSSGVTELIRDVESEHPGRVRRDDRPHELPKSVVGTDNEWFECLSSLYSALTDHHVSQNSPSRPSWTPEQVAQARKILRDLSNQKSKKKGCRKAQHDMMIGPDGSPIPHPIKGSRMHAGAVQACSIFNFLRKKRRADYVWALGQYAQGAQHAHARVSFTSEADAKRFCNLMEFACIAIDGQLDWGNGKLKTGKGRRPTRRKGTVYPVPASPTRVNSEPTYQGGWRWAWQMSIAAALTVDSIDQSG